MFKNYIQIAFRSLLTNKVYGAINIIGLSVGLTAFVLISLYINDETSYDKFHEKSDRICRYVWHYTRPNGDVLNLSLGPYRAKPALEAEFPEFEEIIRISFPLSAMIKYEENEFYEKKLYMVDKEFFDVFSANVITGDIKNCLEKPFSVVITRSLAEKYFERAEMAVGKSLKANTAKGKFSLEIMAVIEDYPTQSHFRPQMLLSMEGAKYVFNHLQLKNWGEGSVVSYFLLKQGVDIKSIEKKFPAWLNKEMGEETTDFLKISLQKLEDIHLKSNLYFEFETNGNIFYVYIFSLIAIFILFLACINYMNLATARYTTRTKEVGVRKVIGANRKQIFIQFIGEAILISLLAVAVAFLLTELTLPLFNALSGKNLDYNIINNFDITLIFILVALATGIVSGSYPAVFLSSFKPAAVLKGATKDKSKSASIRKVLVIIQFSVSVFLIISTSVIYNQWAFLQSKNIGINPDMVLVTSLPRDNYKTFKDELLKDPNVISVSASNKKPTSSLSSNLDYKAENVSEDTETSIKVLTVDYDYFKTLDIKFVKGRPFDKNIHSDSDEGIILNAAAVNEIGWKNPIGKWFETSTLDSTNNWQKKRGYVVGVVENFHFESLKFEIQPMVFFIAPNWMNWMVIKINNHEISETIRFIKEKWELTGDARPFSFSFLNEDIQKLYNHEARFMKIFLAFAILAIFIASLGILGLASFTARQKTKEIGIRKTFGASVTNVLIMISFEFTKLVLIANVIAWPLAWFYLSGWLNNFPYHIGLNAGWFLAAALFSLFIAATTVSLQAYNSAVKNPIEALRYE